MVYGNTWSEGQLRSPPDVAGGTTLAFANSAFCGARANRV